MSAWEIGQIGRVYDHVALMNDAVSYEDKVSHAASIVYYRARMSMALQEWRREQISILDPLLLFNSLESLLIAIDFLQSIL